MQWQLCTRLATTGGSQLRVSSWTKLPQTCNFICDPNVLMTCAGLNIPLPKNLPVAISVVEQDGQADYRNVGYRDGEDGLSQSSVHKIQPAPRVEYFLFGGSDLAKL
jgi:hypothetical protein